MLGYAAHKGVADPPTWTGSVLLDWVGCGTLVSAGALAVFYVIRWIEAPEEDSAETAGQAGTLTPPA